MANKKEGQAPFFWILEDLYRHAAMARTDDQSVCQFCTIHSPIRDWPRSCRSWRKHICTGSSWLSTRTMFPSNMIPVWIASEIALDSSTIRLKVMENNKNHDVISSHSLDRQPAFKSTIVIIIAAMTPLLAYNSHLTEPAAEEALTWLNLQLRKPRQGTATGLQVQSRVLYTKARVSSSDERSG